MTIQRPGYSRPGSYETPEDRRKRESKRFKIAAGNVVTQRQRIAQAQQARVEQAERDAGASDFRRDAGEILANRTRSAQFREKVAKLLTSRTKEQRTGDLRITAADFMQRGSDIPQAKPGQEIKIPGQRNKFQFYLDEALKLKRLRNDTPTEFRAAIIDVLESRRGAAPIPQGQLQQAPEVFPSGHVVETSPEEDFARRQQQGFRAGPTGPIVSTRQARAHGWRDSQPSVFNSVLPESVLEDIESIPAAGRPLRHAAQFTTSPAGAAMTAFAPGAMAQGLIGAAGLGSVGYAAEEFGAPTGTGMGFEVAGGFYGSGLPSAGLRGLDRFGSLARGSAETQAGLRRFLASEQGSFRIGDEWENLRPLSDDFLREATDDALIYRLRGALRHVRAAGQGLSRSLREDRAGVQRFELSPEVRQSLAISEAEADQIVGELNRRGITDVSERVYLSDIEEGMDPSAERITPRGEVERAWEDIPPGEGGGYGGVRMATEGNFPSGAYRGTARDNITGYQHWNDNSLRNMVEQRTDQIAERAAEIEAARAEIASGNLSDEMNIPLRNNAGIEIGRTSELAQAENELRRMRYQQHLYEREIDDILNEMARRQSGEAGAFKLGELADYDNVIFAQARMGVGAAAGASQGDTTEERIRNALIGAGLAAITTPAVVRAIARGVKRIPQGITEQGGFRLGDEYETLRPIDEEWLRASRTETLISRLHTNQRFTSRQVPRQDAGGGHRMRVTEERREALAELEAESDQILEELAARGVTDVTERMQADAVRREAYQRGGRPFEEVTPEGVPASGMDVSPLSGAQSNYRQTGAQLRKQLESFNDKDLDNFIRNTEEEIDSITKALDAEATPRSRMAESDEPISFEGTPATRFERPGEMDIFGNVPGTVTGRELAESLAAHRRGQIMKLERDLMEAVEERVRRATGSERGGFSLRGWLSDEQGSASLGGGGRQQPRRPKPSRVGKRGEKLTPEERMVRRFEIEAPRSEAAWEAQMEEWRQVRGERTTASSQLRDELIAKGMHPDEAIRRSAAEWRGKMPTVSSLGIRPDDEELAFFWSRVLERLMPYEQFNLVKAMDRVSEGIVTGDRSNFKPHEWDLIEKAMGRRFRQAMEKAHKTRPPEGPTGPTVLDEPQRVRMMTEPEIPGVNVGPRAGGAEVAAIDFERGSGLVGVPGEEGVMPLTDPADLREVITRQSERELRESYPSELGPSGQAGSGEQLRFTPARGGGRPATPEEVEAASTVRLEDVGTAREVTPEQRDTVIDAIANSFGLPRSLMTSIDISWHARQGAKIAARHPGISAEALLQDVRAIKSEADALEWMQGLKDDPRTLTVRTPNGDRVVRFGEIADNSLHRPLPGTPEAEQASVMERHEFFPSKWAGKVPLVKQSSRGYVVADNTARHGVAWDILKRIESRNGYLTQAELEAGLNLSKRLTGWGYLGNNIFSKMITALGFAPGYRVSGPQVVANLFNFKNPTIQRIAAENLMTWYMLGTTILGAARLAGATVALTPVESQFGRFKLPNQDTWYNVWGTDQVLARTIGQMIAGVKEDPQGNVTNYKSLGERFRGPLWQYLRSGEDPIIGLFTDVIEGKTYVGEPIKWDEAGVRKVIQERLPLALQDLYDIYKNDGPVAAAASALPVGLGISVASYSPVAEQFRAIPKYVSPPEIALTANEYRNAEGEIRAFNDEIEDIESRIGSLPDGIDYGTLINAYVKKHGLSQRDLLAMLIVRQARGDPSLINPAWLTFAIRHEDELKDRFPDVYDNDYYQDVRAATSTAGVE